jgi:hypothetical protein
MKYETYLSKHSNDTPSNELKYASAVHNTLRSPHLVTLSSKPRHHVVVSHLSTCQKIEASIIKLSLEN